jgi:hypothetical protein
MASHEKYAIFRCNCFDDLSIPFILPRMRQCMRATEAQSSQKHFEGAKKGWLHAKHKFAFGSS